MARIGIAHEVAESILGHALPGVAGVYNRHSFEPEKANALARLAALIERNIDPRSNVVPLTAQNAL